MAQTQLYDAFGLTIASEIPLNELRPAAVGAVADLQFVNRRLDRDLPTEEQGVRMDYDDPDGVFMAWPGVAAFLLVDENTVWVEKYEEAPESFVAFPILGPVMAWMLNWRGLFVLHASAINVNGRTVALMGDKLAGKSTTAAAFLRAGFDLVTDDLLAIDIAPDGSARCLPAFPQLKLDKNASAKVQVEGAQELPLVFEGFTKHQHKLTGMETNPVGIDYLCTLERGGAQPGFTQFDVPQAIEAVSRYSYLPRFGHAPWTKQDRARHFRNCVKLSRIARVGSLHIPDDLDRLDETVRFVVEMLESDAG